MQPSGHDFVTSRAYGPAHVLRQHPQAHIGQGGSLLYPSQSPDQFGHRAYGLARYVEIIQRPAGLNTVIRVRRYLPFAQKSMLPPRIHAMLPCRKTGKALPMSVPFTATPPWRPDGREDADNGNVDNRP